MVLEKIPATIEEITPEWLTHALRSTGVIKNAAVTSVNKADAAFQGNTGPMGRLRLSYDISEHDAPQSLIAKLPSSDTRTRIFLSNSGVYEREILFYEELANEAPIKTPTSYYSAMNECAHEYILLMEDLEDASAGDQLAGCTLEEAELAVRNIALLHAHFWDFEKLRLLEWLPSFNEAGKHNYPVYKLSLPIFQDKYRNRMSAYLIGASEKFGPKLREVYGLLSQKPITLVHGDFRLDNMLFHTCTTGAWFTLLDWQLIKCGRGVIDVAYFLGCCVNEQDRRSAEQDLLKIYWATLRHNGVEAYSFDHLQHDYRLSLFYLLQMAVIPFAQLELSNQRSDEIVTAWLSRLSAALEDHDVVALLTAL